MVNTKGGGINPKIGEIDGSKLISLIPEEPKVLIEKNGESFVALPPHWRSDTYSSFHLERTPVHKRGEFEMESIESFRRMVELHKITDASSIYLSSKSKLVAVIDDHESEIDGQNWRALRVLLDLPLTEDWKEWVGNDKESFGQMGFAEFIETNIESIVEVPGVSPSGSKVLEMALNFEQNINKKFKSSVRLQSGMRELQFIDSQDENSISKMKIFDVICISLRMHRGIGEERKMKLRLRNRVVDGKLMFRYQLIGLEKFKENSLVDVQEELSDIDGVNFYFGKP